MCSCFFILLTIFIVNSASKVIPCMESGVYCLLQREIEFVASGELNFFQSFDLIKCTFMLGWFSLRLVIGLKALSEL